MKLLAALAACLIVVACGATAPGPTPSRTRPPVPSPTYSGNAYACRNFDGPGGGLLLNRDYIGEAKVLQVLGPNDLAVRTNIPLNILIHATTDTKFTPDSARSFADLGVKEGTLLLISVCSRVFDSDRSIGEFKGFYFVAEVTKGPQA